MTIQEKIKQSGLTLSYIAKHSGINKSTVGRIASGKIYAPRKKTTEAIEAVIHIVSKEAKE